MRCAGIPIGGGDVVFGDGGVRRPFCSEDGAFQEVDPDPEVNGFCCCRPVHNQVGDLVKDLGRDDARVGRLPRTFSQDAPDLVGGIGGEEDFLDAEAGGDRSIQCTGDIECEVALHQDDRGTAPGMVEVQPEERGEDLVGGAFMDQVMDIVKADQQDRVLCLQRLCDGIHQLPERDAGAWGRMADQLPVDRGEDCKRRPAPLAVHIHRDQVMGMLFEFGEEMVDAGRLPGGREPPAEDVRRSLAPEARPDQEGQLFEFGIAEEHLVGDMIALEEIGVLKERFFRKSEVS